MSRKNFKVDTANNGQTPKQDKEHAFATVNDNVKVPNILKETKVPTGKVKTKAQIEARKKAREEQYKNFRVNALKRRAKRMGLTDEQIKEKVDMLLKQLDTPNTYIILIDFNRKDSNMFYEMLNNEGLVYKMKSDTYCYVEGDSEVLATIRGFNVPTMKIYPYVKKKPPVLPPKEVKKDKKPSNNSKDVAAVAKKARKNKNIDAMQRCKKNHKDFVLRMKARKALVKARKGRGGTSVPITSKKASGSPKKASTGPEVRHHKYTKAA